MKFKINKKIVLILTIAFIILSGVVFVCQKSIGIDFNDKNNVGLNAVVENNNNLKEDIINKETNNKAKLFSVNQGNEEENKNMKMVLKDIVKSKVKQEYWIIDKLNAIFSKKSQKIIKVPKDYKTIQLAIDDAEFGDRIEVAEGEYKENIIMKEGVSLIGESAFSCKNKKTLEIVPCQKEKNKIDQEEIIFDEKEQKNISTQELQVKNLKAEVTIIKEKIPLAIINGSGFGNVVTFKSGITNKTEFANFVVKNSGKSLSGILIESSSPFIHDNVFLDNEYNVYIKGESYPAIQKNIIQFANKGIQVYSFKKLESTEKESKIDENRQDISSQKNTSNNNRKQPKPLIIDNLITDNKIGIDLYQSSAVINHNTISHNNHYKTYLGATHGIYISKSSAEIKNNIISDNGVCQLCTGINVDKNSKKIIIRYNNIWNNKSNYVCYGDCALEDNNFSVNPNFVDYINGNYRLSEESDLIRGAKDGSNIGVRW